MLFVPTRIEQNVQAFWSGYGVPASTRYIGIPGDYIHRATPRVLEGVERICTGLR